MFYDKDIHTRDIRRFCSINNQSRELLKKAITKHRLSARIYDRILKVGRTIPDLEAGQKIMLKHISATVSVSYILKWPGRIIRV
jgi:magnesium chelatase family protein